MQLRKLKISFSKITHIFISHLHGDHYFGLIGLISTFRLLGRKAELNIFAPKGLEEMILMHLKLSLSYLSYKLNFYNLESKNQKLIFQNQDFMVKTIPLNHRIYTNGFLFEELIHRNRKKSKSEKINSKTYAFCSDTAYYPKIVELISCVDCLYHESTFLDSHAHLAKKTKHSTASDAAKIASMAKVGKLILGHFSNRYKDQDNFSKRQRFTLKKYH